VLRVRNDGIPVVGFTWYSLTDQVDWDVALREVNNNIDPVGLYDMDRKIRPAGRKYKQLISDWRDVLPAQSVCLQVPVSMPSDYEDRPDKMERKEAEARRLRPATTGGSEGGSRL
jgi:hypothetical protein